MDLFIENVRCFSGQHHIPIRPLTILTGENSAGKTTFLAALSAVSNSATFPLQPGFNEPPYNLGSFDTIATNKNGKSGRSETFSMGYTLDSDTGKIDVVASYESALGHVQLSKYDIRNNNTRLTINLKNSKPFEMITTFLGASEERIFQVPSDVFKDRQFRDMNLMGVFMLILLDEIILNSTKEDAFDKHDVVQQIGRLTESVYIPRTRSLAPMRTKPRRTYDQYLDGFSPEGEHIAYLLNRQKSIMPILERFGKESGLFKEFDVKQLGNKPSDPLQIMVTIAGRAANLTDVGYGVSQALPIIVQSVLTGDNVRLLMQQPEVHLHPKAQAALGSFFVDLVANSKQEFVIETHSDYILDRIRQEVASGKINSEDVVFLFFERAGQNTKVHPITLDNLGNIIGAPPSYREFFMQEEINLIRRTRK